MTWSLEASPEFQKDYRRPCAKNATFRAPVEKKVAQIMRDPLHYKPLRVPLQVVRRVHVEGAFVLLFEPDVKRSIVKLLRLAHHDDAYGY